MIVMDSLITLEEQPGEIQSPLSERRFDAQSVHRPTDRAMDPDPNCSKYQHQERGTLAETIMKDCAGKENVTDFKQL